MAEYLHKSVETGGQTDGQQVERKTFNSGGIDISYAKTYSAKTCSTKPCPKERVDKSIILLHGNGENGSIFAKAAELFSNDNVVYCPDSRGHGLSQKVRQLDYSDMAQDIANLIKHEHIKKPVLFGFSDGGIVGLLLAIKYPDLLGKLLIAGINLSPDGLKPSCRRLMKLGFFFSRSDKLRLMLTQPNITAEDLQTIQAPTTVFYAEKDIVKLSHSQAVIDNVKGSKLVVVPNENHASYIIDNTKLCKLLKEQLTI